MKSRAIALAVLLLAEAFPAAAQVRVAAPAAGAGAFAAAAAPLSPASALRQFERQDWNLVLRSYDDPRPLREAILARQDSKIAVEPARLLKLVDRTPELAGRRRLYEEAVLDWSVFSPETRAALTAAGASEELWRELTLPKRYETLRQVFQNMAGVLITAAPGHPDFAAQYEKALIKVGAVMTDEELAGHRESIERAHRLDENLRAAAKAAGASANATASALVETARSSGDLDAAEAAVADASARLGLIPAAAAPVPAYDLTPAESAALEARLAGAILSAVGGTPSGDALLAEIAGTGLRLSIGATSRDGALATYKHRTKTIVLGGKQLARMTSELGRSPRDLLTDDEALADAAVIYSHLYVHEATHHRQHLWADTLPPKARSLAYNHLSEVEANNAQAKFLKEKRAADPAFAAREARLRKMKGHAGGAMRQPERLASNQDKMSNWLMHGYRRVPTLARASARMIRAGLRSDRLERLELPAGGQAESMLQAALALAERFRVELEKLAR
jgi:hypothetical protein